jgi:hypothetical protein
MTHQMSDEETTMDDIENSNEAHKDDIRGKKRTIENVNEDNYEKEPTKLKSVEDDKRILNTLSIEEILECTDGQFQVYKDDNTIVCLACVRKFDPITDKSIISSPQRDRSDSLTRNHGRFHYNFDLGTSFPSSYDLPQEFRNLRKRIARHLDQSTHLVNSTLYLYQSSPHYRKIILRRRSEFKDEKIFVVRNCGSTAFKARIDALCKINSKIIIRVHDGVMEFYSKNTNGNVFGLFKLPTEDDIGNRAYCVFSKNFLEMFKSLEVECGGKKHKGDFIFTDCVSNIRIESTTCPGNREIDIHTVGVIETFDINDIDGPYFIREMSISNFLSTIKQCDDVKAKLMYLKNIDGNLQVSVGNNKKMVENISDAVVCSEFDDLVSVDIALFRRHVRVTGEKNVVFTLAPDIVIMRYGYGLSIIMSTVSSDVFNK